MTAIDYVNAGVAALDLDKPEGWAYLVNPDRLDLKSLDLCVLGQVYRDENCGRLWPTARRPGWGDGMRRLFGTTDGRIAREHGFDCEVSEMAEITALWKDVIRSRQETQ
jgi:hypothetical protein